MDNFTPRSFENNLKAVGDLTAQELFSLIRQAVAEGVKSANSARADQVARLLNE